MYIVAVQEVLMELKRLHAGIRTWILYLIFSEEVVKNMAWMQKGKKSASQLNFRTWNRTCKGAGLKCFPETLIWKQPLKIRSHDTRHFFGLNLRHGAEFDRAPTHHRHP